MANLSNINNVLRVSSDLRVGINTDAASYALEIGGTNSGIKLKNSNPTNGRVYSLLSDTSGNFQIYDDAAASGRLVISNLGNATFAGNVFARRGSFGTASNFNFDLYCNGNAYINDELTVDDNATFAGSITGTTATFTNALNNTNSVNIINTGGTGTSYGLEIKAGTNATDHALQVLDKAGSNLMRVNGAGNVGIGTASPSEILHLNKTSGTGCFIRFQNTGGSGVYIGGRSEVMEMYTNGSEKMRIDSSGNVGIANSNPSGNAVGENGKSLIVGNESAANESASISIISGSSGYSYLLFGDGDGASGYQGQVRYQHSLNNLQFVTGANERMRIDSSGNVGIGTTSPAEKLSVVGGNIRLESTVAGNNGILIIYDSNTTQSGQIYGSAGDLKIYSPADVLFNQIGNVGIGTTSPGSKLEVKTSGTNTTVELDNSDTDYTLIQYNAQGATKGFSGFNSGFMLFGGEAGTETRIQSGGQYAITALTNGNVGIGTTSPNQKLEVTGNIRIDSRSKLGSGEVDNITFTKNRPDAATGTYEMGAIRSFTTNGYSGGMTFYCGRHTGGGSYALISTMTIGHTTEIGLANVGIGTTTPSAKLTVISSGADGIQLGSDTSSVGNSGRIFWSNTSGGWAMMALGQVLSIRSSAIPGTTSGNPRVQLTNYSSTAWTASSDESLKENINSIGNVLDKIDGYRCIEYNLIDDEDKDKKIGFIAQDWQEDFPQIVEQMEDEKIGMKYTETIPILLKAIQELKAEIEILKNK